MTQPSSFAFDDFVVWSPSEPPESLVDYTADTPTGRLSSGTPTSTHVGDVDDVALASQTRRVTIEENCHLYSWLTSMKTWHMTDIHLPVYTIPLNGN